MSPEDSKHVAPQSSRNAPSFVELTPSKSTCSVWAIWLVQWAHTLKVGAWTVETPEAQQRLSFDALYIWLEGRHSLRIRHDLRDPATKRVIHRYVLPFKRMIIPPHASNMFKFRKGAHRLSDWMKSGSSDEQATGLDAGIIAMEPPALVAPPPGVSQRKAKASAAWRRARGAAQVRSRLRSVVGDDAEETIQIVDAVMEASDALTFDSDDELAAELETELERGEAGPSEDMTLDDIRRELMRDSDDERSPTCERASSS